MIFAAFGPEWVPAIIAVCSVLIAWLNLRGRIKENTKITKETNELVNGQSESLRLVTAAKAQLSKDQAVKEAYDRGRADERAGKGPATG